MPSNAFVQSVTRSLDILERVAGSEDGITLQELALALDVAPSTAHNLARTLVARGYLEKASRPTRYRLGYAVFALAQMQQRRRFLQQAAGIVQELAGEIAGATVTLVEARGPELHVVLRVSPELPGRLQQPEGMSMNAYISAHGLVYQAFWTEAERMAYRRRYPFDEFGAHVWQDMAHLEQAIAQVRDCGYAQPTQGTKDLFRIAVPVFSTMHTLAASLGVSLPLARIPLASQPAIRDAVIAAAQRMLPVDDPYPLQENHLC